MRLLEAPTCIWSHHLSVWTAVYTAAVHGSVECQSPHHLSIPDGLHTGCVRQPYTSCLTFQYQLQRVSIACYQDVQAYDCYHHHLLRINAAQSLKYSIKSHIKTHAYTHCYTHTQTIQQKTIWPRSHATSTKCVHIILITCALKLIDGI